MRRKCILPGKMEEKMKKQAHVTHHIIVCCHWVLVCSWCCNITLDCVIVLLTEYKAPDYFVASSTFPLVFIRQYLYRFAHCFYMRAVLRSALLYNRTTSVGLIKQRKHTHTK